MQLILRSIASVIVGAAYSYAQDPAPPAEAPGDPQVETGDTEPAEPTTAPAEEKLTRPKVDWSKRKPKRSDIPEARNVVENSANTASRGDTDPQLIVSAVASAGVDYTCEAAPTVCFHLSTPTTLPIIVSIIRAGDAVPAARWRYDDPSTEAGNQTSAGFHTVKFASTPARLTLGDQYEWVVAVVQDPVYRSRDLVVGGTVQLRVIDEVLLRKLNDADPLDRVMPLINAGFVLDGFAQAIESISSDPTHPNALEYRQLIEQQLSLTAASPAEIRGGR